MPNASGVRSRRLARKNARQSSDALTMREVIAPYIAAQRGRLIRMSAASILGGFAEAGVLVLIARIAFALTKSGQPVTFELGPLGSISASIPEVLGVAAILVVARIILQTFQSVLAARATFATVNATRRDLIRGYLAASWPLQSTQREGRLQELLTTYAAASSRTVEGITVTAIAAFNLAALLVTALAVNVYASVGAGIAALLIGLTLRPMRAALRRRAGRQADAGLEFATGLTELASTLQEIRVFDVEDEVGQRLERLNDRSTDLALRTAYVSGAIQIVYQGIAMVFIVGALSLAYAVDFTGVASLGAVVLIMLRSLTYAQAVQSGIQNLHETAPYVETLRTEQARYIAAAIPRDGRALDRIGRITFDDVTFEYEAGVPVLRNITFEVQPGEIIGIVGPSGAGKSTLVQLLLRLRDPSTGSFLVDGDDVLTTSLESWYRRVTFVPQDAHLFAGSIADNIRFFRDDVDDAAIERAAKMAHLHDDIMGWSAGYDTPVGERGGQISGGQRQRLSIARALVEEPDVVLLDEPTSALDVKSEALMRETMAELAPRKTLFVVAHRLSTLSICDRIMVILGGELQGFDATAQLEASNPFYREALRLSGMRG